MLKRIIALPILGLLGICVLAQQVFAMEEDVAASALETTVANAKMHAIKPEQFKFERVGDSFAREISGESDTWVIRGFRDTMADFELLKQAHGGTDPFVGLFLSRALSRKCEDNPFSQRTAPNPFYSVFVWKKTATGEQEYMGVIGQGVQASFGTALGAGYKTDEHADIIQSFVASGTRVLGELKEDGTREDKQVLDSTGKPLGLVSHYSFLKEVGEEDLLGILESLYNAAVFAKGIGSLLPSENDATLNKQVRTVPHQTYMITDRDGAHDTILQKYAELTGFVRHGADGLDQFYPPKKSVAYSRPIVLAAVASVEAEAK